MTLISIRERGTLHAGPVVSIDGEETATPPEGGNIDVNPDRS